MEDQVLLGVIGRVIERIIVVFFGGIAIYYGFRLFVVLPTQQTGSGKIELPGFSVVLSKVGPGVFFLAFGTVVLIYAFVKPVSIISNSDQIYYGGAVDVGNGSGQGIEQERARVRLAIQVINCLKHSAAPGELPYQADDIELAVTDAKLAMLRSVWDKETWGSYYLFERWARQGLGKPPPQDMVLLFDEVAQGCK